MPFDSHEILSEQCVCVCVCSCVLRIWQQLKARANARLSKLPGPSVAFNHPVQRNDFCSGEAMARQEGDEPCQEVNTLRLPAALRFTAFHGCTCHRHTQALREQWRYLSTFRA